MPASYEIRVDWDLDSNSTEAGDNITDRVLARSPITMRYGRDQARSLSPIAPGTCSFEVDNTSRDYSPENLTSPLAGNLLPGRPCTIYAVGPPGATEYTLFRGYLDEYTVLPGRETRSVAFTAVDALARLTGSSISTQVHQGLRTGAAIGFILDRIGWAGPARDIDAGATVMPWWWEEGTDAAEALAKVVAAEGPGAMVYIAHDGKFTFRDRHHRLTRAASTTIQSVFRDTGGDPEFSGLEYDAGWRDIINSVTFDVAVRIAAQEAEPVWSSDGAVVVPAGESVDIAIQSGEPFVQAVGPVQGVDYDRTGGAITTSLSRTSGQSLTLTIEAPDTAATLTDLQLRARPLKVVHTVQVAGENAASVDAYGRRTYGEGVGWMGVWDARAVVSLILAKRATRSPVVALRVVSANDTRLTHQLSRELSDRVRVIDPETGLNTDLYVEQIQHVISSAGRWLETVFGLEKVGQQLDSPATIFVLDDPTNGVLNTSRLAW